jgi:hypothetical protein
MKARFRASFCAAVWLLLCCAGCAAETAPQCVPRHHSPVTAIDLGDLKDTADSSLPYSGTLDSCENDAYLHFRGHDGSVLDSNKAGLTLGYDDAEHTDELEVCIYAACVEGATKVRSCDVGSVDYFPISSDWGQPGCCRKGQGPIDLTYSCESGLSAVINDAGADFYLHICPTKVSSSSIDYHVEVHF